MLIKKLVLEASFSFFSGKKNLSNIFIFQTYLPYIMLTAKNWEKNEKFSKIVFIFQLIYFFEDHWIRLCRIH